LTHGDIVNLKSLWERFRENLSDDLPPHFREFNLIPDIDLPEQDYTLHLIKQALIEQNKTLTQYQLPTFFYNWNHDRINPLIGHELNYNTETEQNDRDKIYDKLNNNQRRCFDIIIAAVEYNLLTAHFFLQSYAGTGKTFFYIAIYYHFRVKGEIVLCVTSSGIAALFFSGGNTSHSRFRIFLNSYQGFTCPVSKSTQIAGLLERTALII
jgi:hypothetical protein